MNRFKTQNWNPSLAERRNFGLMLAAGSPLSAVVWLVVLRGVTGAWNWPVPLAILLAGGLLGLMLAAVPALARPFYCAWYFLVSCIDITVTFSLLSLMYYLVLTPFALVMRAVGRKPLQKGFGRDLPTYWQAAERSKDVARYFRQF